MQAAKRDNIIKRSRAYHSVVDLDAMDKGRHIYTFKKFCVQDKGLMLGDEATTIFLNTRGTKDDISPKLKAFLEFIEGKVSDDEFVKRLEHRFFEAKQNKLASAESM